MKYTILAALATVAVASAITGVHDRPVEELWEQFKVDHSKDYSSYEHDYRFQVFASNFERAMQRNADERPEGGALHGITKFSDLHPEEFRAMLKGYVPSAQNEDIPVFESQPGFIAAKSVDWRKKGAVTPVKDQAQCGSCWAFSATEEIESAWFLAGNDLTSLSPQQIVSCDNSDYGCNGGDTVTAYQYVEKAGGLETEKAYPYTSGSGSSGKCKFNKSGVVAKISGFKYATKTKDEDQMVEATNSSPLSICVDAESWQTYQSGIIKKNCGTSLDHCVQIVGYASEGKTPYWIVRNSWGTDWGMQGFILVERNKNLCGIAEEATIVEI